MSAYNEWAEYYDLFHNGIPGDVEFYVNQALREGGQTLELGCGTGRITIPLAAAGVDVTGLDNSEAMLDICRAKKRAFGKTSGRTRLVKGDIANFRLPRTFEFVAMPYRAFMHLLTQEEQRSCLACVYRHLKPGGLFIFDTWAAKPSFLLPMVVKKAGSPKRVSPRTRLRNGHTLEHYCESLCDEWRQGLIEKHTIHEHDSSGSMIRTVNLSMTRVWTTPREMALLVALAGFEVEAVLGDFYGTHFGPTHSDMIWILRK
ncbi:MAG: class I SAM-dependent methyltransferase [Candidatus Hydrogenedentes bacterium]|nr:class I SAM-dependent methyltransferase [Candidatus Hydrogenedentota bacterium]